MMIELDNENIRQILEKDRKLFTSRLRDIEWLLSIIGEDELIRISDPLEIARALRRLNII